jgi:hypothetical protein
VHGLKVERYEEYGGEPASKAEKVAEVSGNKVWREDEVTGSERFDSYEALDKEEKEKEDEGEAQGSHGERGGP